MVDGAIAGFRIMLYAAFVFLIISLIAGALGFTGVAAVSGGVAKLIFGFFMLLFILFVILALFVLV